MVGPAEALSALCNGEIRGQPCRHAWLVCLSECHHGDREPALLMEQSLSATATHSANAVLGDQLGVGGYEHTGQRVVIYCVCF